MFFQLRDTRVEILSFLDKFLEKVSAGVKGWEKTYAVDIRVSAFVVLMVCAIIEKCAGVHMDLFHPLFQVKIPGASMQI